MTQHDLERLREFVWGDLPEDAERPATLDLERTRLVVDGARTVLEGLLQRATSLGGLIDETPQRSTELHGNPQLASFDEAEYARKVAAVAAAIKLTYRQAGLRQQDVADQVGVSQSTISDWSRGVTEPDIFQLLAIDQACGQPRGYIMEMAGLLPPGTIRKRELAQSAK